MAALVIHCPNCKKSYELTPAHFVKYTGKTLSCKNCKKPFAFDAAVNAAALAAGQGEPDEDEAES